MKYPTTDEIVLGDNTSRRQEFQGGSIYFIFATGAHAIYGLIRDRWQGLGAETSCLGFPTTDEQRLRTTQISAAGRISSKRDSWSLTSPTTQPSTWAGIRQRIQHLLRKRPNHRIRLRIRPSRDSHFAPRTCRRREQRLFPTNHAPPEPPITAQSTNQSGTASEWMKTTTVSSTGYEVAFPAVLPPATTVGDSIVSKGFGVRRAYDDHNVSSRAVQLIVRNSDYRIPLGYLERCETGMNVVAMPSGKI